MLSRCHYWEITTEKLSHYVGHKSVIIESYLWMRYHEISSLKDIFVTPSEYDHDVVSLMADMWSWSWSWRWDASHERVISYVISVRITRDKFVMSLLRDNRWESHLSDVSFWFISLMAGMWSWSWCWSWESYLSNGRLMRYNSPITDMRKSSLWCHLSDVWHERITTERSLLRDNFEISLLRDNFLMSSFTNSWMKELSLKYFHWC